MATEQPIRPAATVPLKGRPAVAVLRLVLAWFLTLAVVLYAWARTLVMTMLTRRPESLYVGLLMLGLLAVIALTTGLAAAFPRPGFSRRVGLAVAVPWALGNGLLVGLYSESSVPVYVVVALFIPATLWVVWAAWMFCAPLGWRTRLGVLALFLALVAGFVAPLKLAGLTGDTHLNFAWRWQDPGGDLRGAEPAGMTSPAGRADLTRISDHDYPQFLGPYRLGVLREARLARDWKKTPPQLAWRRRVGAGWSAFAVAGDYAVTQEQRGDEECVVCYRLSDGALVWIHEDPTRFDSSMGGPGPRATPTIADGRVYTVGATGLLNCLDGSTGRPLWSVNILHDNQAENLVHGVCGSPLVVDSLVIVSPTGSNGISLAAYDRDTARRVWQATGDRASYGSPLLAELEGVRQVLLATALGVAGHDVRTGQVLWSFPWTNSEWTNCSQPLANVGSPGLVFVSTGYGKGCALVRVERPAGGSWSAQPVWESREMRTKFTTAVYHQGHVYGLDDGILECIELTRGKKVWKDGRYQHGQVLLAGDLLLVQAENGAVALVDPSPQGLRELGRFKALSGKTWNNPALAGRFLLVRNDHEAACYELPLAKD